MKELREYNVEELLAAAREKSFNDLTATVVKNPHIVVDHARAESAFGDVERMTIYYLNARSRIIKTSSTDGTVDRVVVYVREIIKEALMCGAVSLILVHNHPSGESTASANDIKLTESIVKAADLFDIPVMDHIIVTKTDYFSFREENLI